MTCSDAPLFRSGLAAMALTGLLASTPCLAAGETAGPIEIGPSTASADPARSTATLHTVFGNQGDLPDRLIRAECPASGQVALRNGTLHDDVMAPNMSQARAGAAENGRQNGLDVPASVDGKAPMIQADFVLSQAKQPLTQGAHIPCALYFAHDGERIVVFTVGETPTPTAEP